MKHPITGERNLYSIMHIYVLNLLPLYFRQYKLKGFDKIKPNKAIILAPNHQNAFMDAITPLRGVSPRLQFSWLVRASIFGSKFGDWFFKNINLMPVYRQVDGVENLDKNEQIFENCIYLLEQKKILTLFPEGTHHIKKSILPLKKGVSRIAFSAEERNNFSLDIQVIPMGIFYTRLDSFGGDLLIQTGNPIYLRDYIALYKENPTKAHNEIRNELAKRIKVLSIDITNHHYYDCIDFCCEIFANEKEIKQIEDRFNLNKQLISKIENLTLTDSETAVLLKSLSERYADFLKKNNFRDKLFSKSNRPMDFMDWIIYLLATPIGLWGLLNSYFAMSIPARFADKKIKDKGFKSSIKAAFALITFPLFYFLQFLMVGFCTMDFALAGVYFASLPLSYYPGVWWIRKTLHIKFNLRKKKMENDSVLGEAINERNEIVTILNSL